MYPSDIRKAKTGKDNLPKYCVKKFVVVGNAYFIWSTNIKKHANNFKANELIKFSFHLKSNL